MSQRLCNYCIQQEPEQHCHYNVKKSGVRFPTGAKDDSLSYDVYTATKGKFSLSKPRRHKGGRGIASLIFNLEDGGGARGGAVG
jgi:hypothetical protein